MKTWNECKWAERVDGEQYLLHGDKFYGVELSKSTQTHPLVDISPRSGLTVATEPGQKHPLILDCRLSH